MPVRSGASAGEALPASGASESVSSGGAWLYMAQLYGNDSLIYKRMGLRLKLVARLRAGLSAPRGMVATRNGWWYVANGGSASVSVYRTTRHGPNGPVATLDDPGEIPVSVAVVPSRHLVAVSNAATASHGTGSVSVYLDRSSEPARTLTFGSRRVRGMGVALDRHDNCYWSFNDPAAGHGSIVEFPNCSGSGTVVVADAGQAGGLAFDQHDDLYYVDQRTGVYKCVKIARCALFAKGFGHPVNVNFDYRQKHLWLADERGFVDAIDAKTGAIVYRAATPGGAKAGLIGVAPAPGE